MTRLQHPSLGRLIAYALPALPLAALQLPFFVVLPTFYANDVGLGLAAVGTVVLIVILFDAVNDPLAGFVCDRINPRFGRRRLFVMAFSPLAALATWQVMVPPPGASALYFGLWSALLSIGWSGVLIPLAAWGAELADDYAGRTRVAAAREIATVAGTLVAISVPAAVQLSGAADQRSGLFILAAILVIIIPASSWATVFLVPEPRNRSRTRVSIREGLRYLSANEPFRRLILAFLVSGIANGLPATLFLLFVGVGLDWDGAQGPLLFLYFVCGILGVPIWLRLSRRIGKHRAWAVAMMIACVAFVWIPLLGPDTRYLYLPIVVVTGLTLAADLTLPTSIQADVIDVDTAASGEQRSGIYFAAWGLAAKLSLAAAAGFGFMVLDWVGLKPAGEAQSPTALLVLALLYGAIPVVLKGLAIVIIWRFPLDETAQRDLRQKIEESMA